MDIKQNESWIPNGLTENECVNILYEIASRVAPKYRFGYHSNEDMISQAVPKGIEILQAGKFKPRGEKPIAQQLRNFLRIWLRNRMSNYRRDNSCRYTNPDSDINRSKYNIMHPLHIHSYGLTSSEIFARLLTDKSDNNEIIEKLLQSFNVDERKLFLKKVNGVKLNEKEEKYLLEVCQEILGVSHEEEGD